MWKLFFVRAFAVPQNALCNAEFTAKAIDRYIEVRSEEQTSKSEKVDPRLQAIIENIFARCIEEREYKQVRYLTRCRLLSPC
jgi:26S proteasome regulatory subunit N2